MTKVTIERIETKRLVTIENVVSITYGYADITVPGYRIDYNNDVNVMLAMFFDKKHYRIIEVK